MEVSLSKRDFLYEMTAEAKLRIDRLDNLANQRVLMLANRLGDVAAQFTLSPNNLLVFVEPSACELQQLLPITGP